MYVHTACYPGRRIRLQRHFVIYYKWWLHLIFFHFYPNTAAFYFYFLLISGQTVLNYSSENSIKSSALFSKSYTDNPHPSIHAHIQTLTQTQTDSNSLLRITCWAKLNGFDVRVCSLDSKVKTNTNILRLVSTLVLAQLVIYITVSRHFRLCTKK